VFSAFRCALFRNHGSIGHFNAGLRYVALTDGSSATEFVLL